MFFNLFTKLKRKIVTNVNCNDSLHPILHIKIYYSCSASHLSASIAAAQPVPAAVTACL